ncbi:MAG TPA: hypothetical protein VIX19_04685 [Terriglobales bacterium]
MAGRGESPGRSPEIPDDINSRLAEVAAELTAEAKFHEPTAAERARVPVRAMHSWSSPTPMRPRHARSVLAAAVVVALLFAAGMGLRNLLRRSPPPAASSSTRPARAGSKAPQTLPFTTADPFAGTPAQSYADGAAGIVLPAAHRVGSFTSAQVASAYQTMRKLLIAGELDASALQGASPEAFGSLLTPQQRSWFYHNLSAAGRTALDLRLSTRAWVTQFVPGSTELVGKIIKVHGLPMTASVVKYGRLAVLGVLADYLFVYPAEQPGAPVTRILVVAHIEETVYFWPWNDPGGPLEPRLADVIVSYSGATCGQTYGYVQPQFGQSGSGGTPGGARSPFDLAGPLSPGSCAASTGT